MTKLVFKYPKERTGVCTIYIATCPETDNVMYIGQTDNLKERTEIHLFSRNKTKFSQWVFQLKERKLRPVFKEIDIVPANDALYWEAFYIQLFRSWGFNLLNSKCNNYTLK